MSWWRRWWRQEEKEEESQPIISKDMIIDTIQIRSDLFQIWKHIYMNDNGGNLWCGEEEYYSPTLAEVKTFLNQDLTDRLLYISRIRDCDKFGFLLLARCYEYVAKQVESGKLDKYEMRQWAFAETWGYKWNGVKANPKHAVCMCRTRDAGIIGIGPQTDHIWYPLSYAKDKPYYIRF